MTGVFGDHVALSVTNRCPIKCAHCVSGSGPDTNGADAKLSTGLVDFLVAYQKTRLITFTGGEPFDDVSELARLAEICRSLNIHCSAITSAFWAKSQASAQETMERIGPFYALTISTDVYHQRYVPLHFIRNAYLEARRSVPQIKVRLTRPRACSKSDELAAKLAEFVEPEHFEECDLVPYGRADKLSNINLPLSISYGRCPTTGPHVFEGGRLIPCCNSIVALDSTLLLDCGNVIEDATEAVHTFQNNLFYLVIKTVGFDFIVEYARSQGVEFDRFFNSCDFCYHANRAGDTYEKIVELLEGGLGIAALSYLFEANADSDLITPLMNGVKVWAANKQELKRTA